jgi:proline dehydrogenase
MNLSRKAILGVADIPQVKRLFENNNKARALVNRFVAGDTVEDAIAVATRFKEQGITVTLDLLGENVNSETAAAQAVISYADVLRQAKAADIEPNVSLKLTMLGMDLGDELATANLRRILDVARDVGGFVRVDMESSDYTERTLDIFRQVHDEYGDHVGIVLQTMLRRTGQDVLEMIDRNARVRLVKGAYAEPDTVAMGSKENDEVFRQLMRMLMQKGNYPAIATHDMAIIDDAMEYARKNTITPDRYEFQMLYGVRTADQERLRSKGYNMRVYTPFGKDWYPYYTRRIAERPANALFVARQFLDRS